MGSDDSGRDSFPDLSDDEDDGPVSRRICVDCKKLAPKTRTSHTLISARYGWRLTRRLAGEGAPFEWRCPDCFLMYKTKVPPR